MNKYLTILGYEYKKILNRPSTWIVLLFALMVILMSCFADVQGKVYVEGKAVDTHYQQMKTDRAYARELAGRNLDDILIGEMQLAYKHVPDVPLYSATMEYNTYARPYSSIYHLVGNVTKNIQADKNTRLMIFDVDGTKYYTLRNEALLNKFMDENLSKVEVSKHMEMDQQVKKPFVFEYTDGFGSIMSRMTTIGFILTLTLAVCFAPMFANEYTSKTDQLILTSKWGKNKAIVIKLFAGLSFGFVITCIFLLVEIIPTLFIYGSDGWNSQIQLLNVLTTYPFTVLEGVMILIGMSFASSLLIVSLCMFLSARLKSSFAVIIIISTFLILIMFVSMPQQYRFLYQLINMLPINIMSEKGAFTDYFIVIFGKCIPAYQSIPIIYTLINIILLVFCYRTFKNHQVS